MTINTKALVGIRVMTRSGRFIGKVASFDFEQETGRMAYMHVKAKGLVQGLIGDELLISWSQIIEITADLVIVADGAISVTTKKPSVIAPLVRPASSLCRDV